MPRNLPNVIPLDSLILGEGIDVIRHAHFINMKIIDAVCAKNIVSETQKKHEQWEDEYQSRKESIEQVALMLADEERREEIKNNKNINLNGEESEKMECKEEILRRNKEILHFDFEKSNLLTKIGQTLLVFDKTSDIIMKQKLKNDSEDELEAKLRLRREKNILKENRAVIKEEIQKKIDKISKTFMEQNNEVNELGLSINEIPKNSAGLNRLKEILDALVKVVEAHKILFREHQKLKIELADLAANEYTDYFIKKESQKVDKIKDWDFHQDLREQGWSGINVYNTHQEQMMELYQHEGLIKILSSNILSY